MQHYNFIATNEPFNFEFMKIDEFVDSFPDFQTVALKDDEELLLLFNLIGITSINHKQLDNPNFSKFWDISEFRITEFSEEEFDSFFKKWITSSKREGNMDEFGNLVFLQGKSREWNLLKNRYVVKEVKAHNTV